MTRILLTLICVSLAARAAQGQEGLKPEDILGHDTEISLLQAVELGLEYNLTLDVVRNDPALARERVNEAEGVYDPLLLGRFNQTHIETPVASSLQSFFGTSGNRTTDNGLLYNGGLLGVLPWGPSYSSGYTFQRLNSNSGLTSLKPQYTSGWTNSLTVPLLRGLYWSTPDLLVRRTTVGQQISDATFTSQLADGVFLVESTYWQLAAARAFERATAKGVDTAKDLLEQTKVQYQVGTVSKVLVTQAEAGVAQRESDYIVALNAAKRAQDILLSAILAPSGISDYSTTTVRTEEPTFLPYEIDPEQSVQKARANRSELMASQLQVEDADIQKKYAWNQTLPQFDVGASYTMNGLSGTQKVPAGTPRLGLAVPGPGNDLNNPIIPVVPQPDFGFGTSRWSANRGYFDGEGFHSWTFGANFSYPLGNESADSRYIQRKIELRRAKTTLRRTEQDIILDVRTAVRELQSAIDRVKAAERARVASEETLAAEQERLRLGDSTPHNVLLFQEGLLRAEGNEINARQVYRTAISALERAQGTLLEARGISVEKERDRGMDEY
jgi:outer membrane protein TolC